jgi:hypothetical protein
MKHYLYVVILYLCATCNAFSQTVTGPEQDCPNAIPICKNLYQQEKSYSGAGNNPNEIDGGQSCLKSSEKNDVWYTFTVQLSGYLSFMITPKDLSEDYDWAVYNLTNAQCSDIKTNRLLEVSCNFSNKRGQTGPNGGSLLSTQPANGTPFNAKIPVAAGETYVINVSNYENINLDGYTIDFSSSTAKIFDDVKPFIDSIPKFNCGASSFVVFFSENVRCPSVEASDFVLEGPGGPYTITSVKGANCGVNGGTYDRDFTFTFTPPIRASGTLIIRLVGEVVDLCDNTSIPGQFEFTTNYTVAHAGRDIGVCPGENRTTGEAATGGVAPYKYKWKALDNENGIVGADNNPTLEIRHSTPGIYRYEVLATDVLGCSGRDTVVITIYEPPSVKPITDVVICSAETVTLKIEVEKGTLPYIYKWTALDENGIIGSTISNLLNIHHQNSGTFSYQVKVTDANGCSATADVKIIVRQSPIVNGGADIKIICIGDSTEIGVGGTITGGTAPYVTKWKRITAGNANIINDASLTTKIHPTLSGLYVLEVKDANGCFASDTVFCDVRLIPDANAGTDVTECVCEQKGKEIGVKSHCGVEPFRYEWTALGGAPIGALSATTTVPITVKVNENTPITKQYLYVLTVTDGQNQSRSDTVIYTLHPCPIVSAGKDTILCGPALPFQLKPNIIGVDESGMNYSWSPATYLSSATSKNPTVTLPDSDITITYSLTVSDKNSCTANSVITIKTAKTLRAVATSTKSTPNCICRGDEITLTATQTGGTPPFTYSWLPSTNITSPQTSTTTAAPLVTTKYTVTITDARGCTDTAAIDICVEPVPNPHTGSDTTICEGGMVQRGENATCGKAPFKYKWSPSIGVNNPDTCCPIFTPMVTTPFTLEVTDAGGAKNSAMLTITVNPKPKVTATSDKKSYCAGEPIKLTGNAVGKGGFKYAWFNHTTKLSEEESPILTSIDSTTILTLIVTDTNGCVNEASIPVEILPNPSIVLNNVFVCPCDTIELNPTVTGGTPEYTYEWTNVKGGNPIGLSSTNTKNVKASPAQTEQYILTVKDRDGNGCTTSTGVTVTVGDNQVVAKLKVPDILADPRNKNVAIPIIIDEFPAALKCPPKGMQFSLSYNENLYDPFPRISQGTILSNNVVNGVRTLVVNLTQQQLSGIKTGDVLTTIIGAALLGNPGETDLTLSDISWNCSSVQSSNSIGKLSLDSLCLKPNGSKRLLSFNQGAAILSIVPNPTNGISYVSLQRFNGEEANISVYTALGNQLYSYFWKKSDVLFGEEAITLPIAIEQQSGVYHVVVRSSSGVSTEQLVLVQ